MKKSNSRVIGLDVHPDSFAGAILEGADPASAKVVSTSTRVALPELEKWVERHTTGQDLSWSWKPAATPLPWRSGCAA